MNIEHKWYADTQEKLDYWRSRMLRDDGSPRQKYLGFDTETNGVYFFRNVVIGYSIALNDREGFYVPLLEWVPDETSQKLRTIKNYGTKIPVFERGHFIDPWTGQVFPEFVTPDEFRAPQNVIDFVADTLPKFLLIMHNAPFDCNIMHYNFGVDLAPFLFLDTILGKHFLDENTRHGLKETGELWAEHLGFAASEDAKMEQKELGTSIVRNGGTFNARTKHIWRGERILVAKYAIKDVFLTLKIAKHFMKVMKTEYEQKHMDLFFKDEIMPLCREVVIPMIYRGAHIDVDHFKALNTEIVELLKQYEDRAIRVIEDHLATFPLGKSMDEVVTTRLLVTHIADMEGLELPKQTNKKGITKVSFAKKVVQAAQAANPHWLWGYLLKQNEIMWEERDIQAARQELYVKKMKRRYRFNINSPDHLIWLFFKKLGESMTNFPKTDSSTPEKPRPSMDAEVLEELLLKKYPEFLTPVLTYRKLSKLYSSYIQPAINLNHDSWLHLELKQFGTISGRFSCGGGFNLQTLPKVEVADMCTKCQSKNLQKNERLLLVDVHCMDCNHAQQDVVRYSQIKRGFTAPPGYKIQNADYSSLEPRCFAFMSGDPKLKEIFQKDLDMYSKVYCDMMDTSGKYSPDPKAPNFLKKLNPEARDGIKPCVLSIPYGSRDAQVANLMGYKKTIRKTDDEGRSVMVEIPDVKRGGELRQLYLNTYADLRNYMDQCDIEAVSKGYVETIYGRRRRFQYTQNVYKIISHIGMSIEEFLDHKVQPLKFEATDSGFTAELLEEFCQAYDIYPSEMEKKGNWAYVRGVFKNELNNAKNIRIQGLAAHITNRAMLEYTRAVKRRGLDSYIFLQVHDEISSYTAEHQVELTLPLLKGAMERNKFAKGVDVPMKADPVVCDNLKESK